MKNIPKKKTLKESFQNARNVELGVNIYVEDSFFKMLNQERQLRGIAPIQRIDPAVSGISENHALDMIKNNFWGHIGSDGKNSFDRLRKFEQDYIGLKECLYAVFGFHNPEEADMWALYHWIYHDEMSEWRHRKTLFQEFNDADGDGEEGIAGIATVTSRKYDPFNKNMGNSTIVVFNVIDPYHESKGELYDYEYLGENRYKIHVIKPEVLLLSLIDNKGYVKQRKYKNGDTFKAEDLSFIIIQEYYSHKFIKMYKVKQQNKQL